MITTIKKISLFILLSFIFAISACSSTTPVKETVKEKEILGKVDDGRQAAPNVIIDGANFLYLSVGIKIVFPITEDANKLINALRNLPYTNDFQFGNMVWIFTFDPKNNILIFEDMGM